MLEEDGEVDDGGIIYQQRERKEKKDGWMKREMKEC